MLAKDERRPLFTASDAKTGTGINATPFIEAMSPHHKVADGPAAHAMPSATDPREGIRARIYPSPTLTAVA